jgi:hypothetical protein
MSGRRSGVGHARFGIRWGQGAEPLGQRSELDTFSPGHQDAQSRIARDRRAAFHDRLKAEGRPIFRNEGKRCGCGRVALFVWKDRGYCRRCKPERVAG